MQELKHTPMNNFSETSSWLSDLEMDECNLFPEECNLNFLDDDEKGEFLSHDIATVFQEQTQQQCLTLESTLSNSFTDDETNFDSFDFDFEIERPTKQLKTIDQSENITETFSSKLSPSSSYSSFQSQILSFDNITNSPAINTPQFHGFTPTLNTKQNENLETKTSQTKRSRNHGHDHIMAERKRREKLSHSFIALAALVPNLKKMDKASVLTDSIKYMKELKERLKVLEEQNKKQEAESVVVLKKQELCTNDVVDNSSSCDESIEGAKESLLHVEARVSGKDMLIRIHCQKHKGLLVKIMAEIQSFQLFFVSSSVIPFGDSMDITIIAQIGECYNLSIKELVKNLRMAALKFTNMSS